MRTLLLLTALWLAPLVGNAATNIAANLTLAEVQSKIATAAHGDTILLPAGNNTWTGTLLFTNPVNLIGAGTNSTFLTGVGQWEMISVNLATDKPTRISGITFQQTSVGGIYIHAVRYYGKATAVRLDHCKFINGRSTVWTGGWIYGVMDHNTWLNGYVCLRPYGDNGASWARGFQVGTTNALVIENNWFIYNGDYPLGNDSQEMIYTHEGARNIIRFNNFMTTADYPSEYSGICMGEEYREAGQESTMWIEFYGNNIDVNRQSSSEVGFVRGGSTLWYSNTVDQVSANGFHMAYAPTYSSIPGYQSPSNCFYWANTANGAPTLPWVRNYGPWVASYVVENVQYWNVPPSAGNGSPAGVYANYTGLSYPHPIVVAQEGGTNPPAGPTASFTGTPVSGTAPLQVTFVDSSTGSPTSWLWDFKGEGSATATTQNASYTYATAGSYTVKLTVANAEGTNSVTYVNYITVTNTVEPTPPAGITIRTPSANIGGIRLP
jgi:PKD repeat protein